MNTRSAVFLFLFLCSSVMAQGSSTRYFMLIFASQDPINSFRGAHSFASFVKEVDGSIEETQTISWFPKSGRVCLFCYPEPGMNLPLIQSIEDGSKGWKQVTLWGPYEIKEELYFRVKPFRDLLNSGQIQFKAVDSIRSRSDHSATNCEHAISDIDHDKGYLHTHPKHGNSGSRAVLIHLKRWILNPETTHDSIRIALGLHKYPMRLEHFFTPLTLAP